MIRALTAAPRSILLPNHVFIRHRAFARCNNSYAQPFPYYGEPLGRYEPEPFPRHHADRLGYHSDHNFDQFHPGANSRGSRLGHRDFESYPGRVSWRGYGAVCYCRCCGCPFWGYLHQPVNYAIGSYRDGGVQGIGYGHSGRYQTASDYYYKNHNGSAFHAMDGRSYDGNSSYYPRNPNQNFGQHRNNWGDSHYDTVGVPLEKWCENQNVANDGNSYRQHQNSGDRCNHNVRSQSTSNYNQYDGPEHIVYSESNKFHQQTGHVGLKNSLTDKQNGGRSVRVQSQDVSVKGHPMNSDGASGEFQHIRQSPGISDVVRNENNHGSCVGNQNDNTHTSSNPAGVWGKGNYGHQDFNDRYNENSNGFYQNPNVSHGQNSNIDPNGELDQKLGEAGRIFRDNQSFKQNSFNVGYEQTKDVDTLNSLRNQNGPFPEFVATNQPLKSTMTSFETNQMPDINDSRNVGSLPRRMVDGGSYVSNRSNQSVGRCQRIIDVLETEDKYGSKGPGNRSVSLPRNDYANQPI